MDLKKARMEIERLQEQLRYAIGKQKNYGTPRKNSQEGGSDRKHVPE